MRIISGKYKGRRFTPPKNFKARPTTDFAKENLFNIINNYFDWEDIHLALDLFGGTGGISFEMISRGCSQVICVEKDFVHSSFIDKTKNTLEINNLVLSRMDVFKYLENSKSSFDFIFADPPYDLSNFDEVPRLVLDKNLLNVGGLFILEHSKNSDFSSLPFFTEKRVYGSVNFSFFVRK